MSAQPFERRIASLEGSYRQVSARLNSIDRRIDGLEQRMEARFNALEQKVDGRFSVLDAKIDRLSGRMTALILGTWIPVMASILLRH